MIVGTYNGANILALPSDVGDAGVFPPSSIEWDTTDIVSVATNPFTGAQDVYDWGHAFWTAQLSFNAMTQYSSDSWRAFLAALRGPVNVFLAGDPKSDTPKGAVPLVRVPIGVWPGGVMPVPTVANAPVVNGAGQSGFVLNVKGLTPSLANVFLRGDLIQVGLRCYRVTADVSADGSGEAALPVWPNLRQTTLETITDGQLIVTAGCKGLYRLAKSSGNKYSVSAETLNGLGALAIREAF